MAEPEFQTYEFFVIAAYSRFHDKGFILDLIAS